MQRNHQVSFGLFVVIYYFDIHVRPSLWQRPPVPSHFGFLSCSEFQKHSQTAAERGKADTQF